MESRFTPLVHVCSREGWDICDLAAADKWRRRNAAGSPQGSRPAVFSFEYRRRFKEFLFPARRPSERHLDDGAEEKAVALPLIRNQMRANRVILATLIVSA